MVGHTMVVRDIITTTFCTSRTPPPPQTNPGEYNSASVSVDTSQETASPTGSRGPGEESVAVEMEVDEDDDRGMSGANGGAATADDDVLRAKDEAIAVGWFVVCLLSCFDVGGGGRRCGIRLSCLSWVG